MSKIDLTSKEWCELVFEGKNKEYGAYRLRQDSTKRHIRALIIVLIFAVVFFSLPTLISIVTPKDDDRIVVTTVTELTNLEEAKTEEKEVQEVKPELPPPPPEIKTIKFTPPVITRDEVSPEEEMKTMKDVTESTAAVGNIDKTEGMDVNEADLDQLKDIVTTEQPGPEKPYEFVEQMPQYPGGEPEMRAFIAKNLRYPTIAQENGIQGRVIVRFVVSKTGEISEITVVRGIDPLCDKEAVRVIKMMPKWIPGKQNGNEVSVIYNVPVVFKLI